MPSDLHTIDYTPRKNFGFKMCALSALLRTIPRCILSTDVVEILLHNLTFIRCTGKVQQP